MKRSELFFTALLVPLDFLMIILAALTAYALRFSEFIAKLRPPLFTVTFPRFLALSSIIALSWLIIFALCGLYNIKQRKRFVDDLVGAFIGVSTGVMAFAVFTFFRSEIFESRFIIIAGWFFAIMYVTFGHFAIRLIQKWFYKYGIGVYRVVIVGKNPSTRHLIKNFRKLHSGYRIVSQIKKYDLTTLANLERLAQKPGIDEIIQANPDLPKENFLELISFCDDHRIDFKYIPGLFGTEATNIGVTAIEGIPIVEFKRTPLDGWGKIIKRLLDIVFAVLGLIFLFPLFLVCAIAIKIDSPGPVLVKLKRVSQRRVFYLYKFRSMIKGAHAMKKKLLGLSERRGPLFKLRNDPRVTRVGRILRRTRIDELPQLINVLRNEMSIVGPRPHEPEEVAQYKKHQRKVLMIKPGITGMAQVSGASDLDFSEEVRLDTYYIENWSLKLDLQIIFRTIFVVLSGTDTY